MVIGQGLEGVSSWGLNETEERKWYSLICGTHVNICTSHYAQTTSWRLWRFVRLPCVTEDKSLNFSKPQFFYLQNEVGYI